MASLLGSVIIIDRGWDQIYENALALSSGRREYKVGVGIPNTADQDILDRAFWAELGTTNQPARPFMRKTADDHQEEAFRLAQRLEQAMFDRKIRVGVALDRMGQWYADRIRATIQSSAAWAAPNAKATLMQKEGTTPLIDTQAMLNAISWSRKA